MKKIYNHSIDIDKKTLNQFKACYSKDFVVSAALMPDAHLGYSAPIGAVIKTKDFVVPAWVGFDIGCGLIAIKFSGKNIIKKVDENKEKIYKQVLKKMPMGAGKYNNSKKINLKTKKEFEKILKEFEKSLYNKQILNFLKNSSFKHLGTLGGGNHFIELDINEKEKELWLIIHSGSRGIGHFVGKKYMIDASGNKKNFEKTFPLEAKSNIGKEYLNIIDFGLKYALLNRLEIAYNIIDILEKVLKEKIKYSIWANKVHNSVIYEKGFYIHRKGATPAKKGERGIIPGNMRDGTFLVKGLGNEKFLNSSSHGAGRKISVSDARKKYSIKEFEEIMEGIQSNVSKKTLGEIPLAYKNLFRVMEAQKESVKIVKYLKPLINWKG